MWERACSRKQLIIQRIGRLTHRFREQARSHRVSVKLPTGSLSAATAMLV
ncbi:hypothetical protein PMI18_02427 [Pseudomonas sp. GM102]|nr:hypothetical protein PMI18_02427 [Pseudomonas sp. GM102]